MTFPFDDVISANGSLDRAVLLSERSQLIAIKVLQVAENRANWDDMSDSDWDTLEDYVADALTEILTIQSGGGMAAQKTAQRTSDINFSANMDVPVQWNAGDYDTTNNSRVYADVSGVGIVTANAHIATLSTAHLNYCWIRRNGTQNLARSHVQVGIQNGEHAISWSGDIVSGDYFELCVRASNNSKVSVLNADAHLGMTIL